MTLYDELAAAVSGEEIGGRLDDVIARQVHRNHRSREDAVVPASAGSAAPANSGRAGRAAAGERLAAAQPVS